MFAAVLLGAVVVPAQQVQAVVPIGAVIQPASGASDDSGVPVEMFENPNLDRYLRRAQAFLEREDYAAAIQVLQDVVEGRTVEVVGSPGEAAAPVPSPIPGEAAKDPPPGPRTRDELDARRAVFSADGRLYRPVRRLCHELLARLPDIGIELYRANYEVAAAELLEGALADGSVPALEAVANRYFVTLAAGRAMVLLADRLMHEGRYRAAVQVLRDLVQVYPVASRRRLGIDDVWCGFKIALCLRLAGDAGAARSEAEGLAARHPDATLRLLGELQAVRDLPTSEVFADVVLDLVGPASTAPTISCLDAGTDELVPVWQYRFADPEPYREPKAANGGNRVIFVDDGMRATTMPHASRYGPATWVTFVPAPGHGADDLSTEPRAVFLEHYRLRVAAAESGLLLAEGDGVDRPPMPRENHPRVRIAASDFALLRPVCDDTRLYAVLGHSRNTTSSVESLKSSELVAYERGSLQRAWSSAQWHDGDDGLRDVTFLAAPAVFGERLLLPALRRDVYELRCLDRRTGRPLWFAPIHAGGTPFFKAPGAPVVVRGGVAFVATNAGCVAAIDAFTGDLRWIRRYERSDPLRSFRRNKRADGDGQMRFGEQFLQADLPGFAPNPLVVADGLVVLAACDSDLLLCLDSASGEPVWMLDGTTRHAPYGKLRELVGATATELYFVADKALVCIELRGGLVKWARDLPASTSRKSVGRGRGTVVGDQVLVPGDREIFAFDAHGELATRRIPLPPFDPSRDPLDGSFDITTDGPLLAVGYQGGVEVLSSRPALRRLAATVTDASRRANLLVLAGERAAAEAVLTEALQRDDLAAPRREALTAELLQLVRARADQLARSGQLTAGLAALDGIADLLPQRQRRLEWHLARLDICGEAGDLRAHEREQQRLYDYMEGRR
ncbi:MAG: PQQ-like beta-propeller repeat protein [Planctomycetes bacterium]|nr:PQQ-like beta-propeller repeat protein [Planctomycetota bacterium]